MSRIDHDELVEKLMQRRGEVEGWILVGIYLLAGYSDGATIEKLGEECA